MTNIPYSEIKAWYLENKDLLPDNIGSEHMMVLKDFPKAFQNKINEMDAFIEEYGDKANKRIPAKTCYGILMHFYTMANDPSTHGKGVLNRKW